MSEVSAPLKGSVNGRESTWLGLGLELGLWVRDRLNPNPNPTPGPNPDPDPNLTEVCLQGSPMTAKRNWCWAPAASWTVLTSA